MYELRDRVFRVHHTAWLYSARKDLRKFQGLSRVPFGHAGFYHGRFVESLSFRHSLVDCTTRWSNPSSYLAQSARYLWVFSQMLTAHLSLRCAYTNRLTKLQRNVDGVCLHKPTQHARLNRLMPAGRRLYDRRRVVRTLPTSSTRFPRVTGFRQGVSSLH